MHVAPLRRPSSADSYLYLIILVLQVSCLPSVVSKWARGCLLPSLYLRRCVGGGWEGEPISALQLRKKLPPCTAHAIAIRASQVYNLCKSLQVGRCTTCKVDT